MAKRYWPIRGIKKEIVPRLRYIAVYRPAPVSAITHYAPITRIENRGSENVVLFGRPKPIGPLVYVPEGNVRAVQYRQYAQSSRLRRAKTLDDALAIY